MFTVSLLFTKAAAARSPASRSPVDPGGHHHHSHHRLMPHLIEYSDFAMFGEKEFHLLHISRGVDHHQHHHEEQLGGIMAIICGLVPVRWSIDGARTFIVPRELKAISCSATATAHDLPNRLCPSPVATCDPSAAAVPESWSPNSRLGNSCQIKHRIAIITTFCRLTECSVPVLTEAPPPSAPFLFRCRWSGRPEQFTAKRDIKEFDNILWHALFYYYYCYFVGLQHSCLH